MRFKNSKNKYLNKGISLISLVITIVVMIILAAIVIINGFTRNVDEANFAKMYNEAY